MDTIKSSQSLVHLQAGNVDFIHAVPDHFTFTWYVLDAVTMEEQRHWGTKPQPKTFGWTREGLAWEKNLWMDQGWNSMGQNGNFG